MSYSTLAVEGFQDFKTGSARHVLESELTDANVEIYPRCWVKQSDFAARMVDRNWQRDWFLSMRDVTNATNERTAIFSLRPRMPANDKLPTIFVRTEPSEVAALYANLAALVLDYVARQKVGGTNLASFIVEQFPILPPSAYSEADLAFIIPRVLELTYTSHSMAPFARDLGYEGAPFAWNEDRRAQLRAELDAWFALAYGLTRDELRYVLDPADVMGTDYPSETFRVLKSNEKRKFGEYRTRRLVLAAYDALFSEGLRPRLEGYR